MLEYKSGLGSWYDYGARFYDPATSSFTSIDRFAEKYAFQSPFAYATNNPIKFIDVNGDSINVSNIMRENPGRWESTHGELEKFTGLSLTVDDSGNLGYTKPEGKLSGSKRARKMLISAIEDEETVTVYDNTGGISYVPISDGDPSNDNEVHLAFDKIDLFISAENRSPDLDSRAYGDGLTFFHELGHTRVGGYMKDAAGRRILNNVRNVNRIRRELGPEFGQRVDYFQYNVKEDPNNVYFAFSRKARRALKAGILPSGGYFKIPKK